MRTIDRYLGKLVKARLNGEKAEAIPEDVTVSDIIFYAHRSQMKCLILSSLLNVDNLEEDDISH